MILRWAEKWWEAGCFQEEDDALTADEVVVKTEEITTIFKPKHWDTELEVQLNCWI